METVVTAIPRAELLGGPQAVDSLVMRAVPRALVAKREGRGLLCVGLRRDGVALKVEDGAYRPSYRGGCGPRDPELAERPLQSSRGDEVGTIAVDG